jgi:hypothetical protein
MFQIPFNFVSNSQKKDDSIKHLLSTQPTQPTQTIQLIDKLKQLSKLIVTDNDSFDKPKVRRFWPEPASVHLDSTLRTPWFPINQPLIESTYQYQNINKDMNLRKDVTKFFQRKILKWIDNYSEFSHLKSQKKHLESIEGQMHIYNLLRKFIKRSKINWYDLRDNYTLVKEYLAKKL